jgi:hypothetical protein
MAHGVILKHLEVDKITWGSFSKKTHFRRGADGLFGGKAGRGALFLTGVDNTAVALKYLITPCNIVPVGHPRPTGVI